MKQYLIEFVENSSDSGLVATPMSAGEPGLGLDENGLTWHQNNAPVKIEIVDDEPRISCMEQAKLKVSIDRNHRSRLLKPNTSVRLLANDFITVGSRKYAVKSIYRSGIQSEAFFKKLRDAGQALMLSMAAALVLSSCNVSKAETPVKPLTGDVAVVDPVDSCLYRANAAECCLSLDDEQKKDCCAQLKEKDPSQSCELLIKKDIVAVQTTGIVPRPVYLDKAGTELKDACLELEKNSKLREDCCRHLEDTSDLTCDEEVSCEKKNGQERIDCCMAIQDKQKLFDCCNQMARETGLSCDIPKEVKANRHAGIKKK